MISLDLQGSPVPQARPRIFKKGSRISAYDPKNQEKQQCKWQLRSQFREEPIKAPVSIDLTFYMPIPKNVSGVIKRQMLNGVCYHMARPDIDNLQKFTLDCLNDIVLADDSQVVEIRARKIFSTKPGTLIRINVVSDQTIPANETNQREG
jgi:Holliday junction resolvase RusA-like endonuclease